MARRSVVATLVLYGALALRPSVAGAVADADANANAAEPAAAPAAPSLKVAKLHFRGNRKVEDDAIKVNLKTAPGVTLTQEMLREDVHAIWKMGYFDDVQVEVQEKDGGKAGVIVAFVLREKPAINKIY